MWNDTDTPLAYFISFRAYGTWLHGDKRGSIDRFHNRYRAPYIQASDKWRYYNEQRLRSDPLILKARHRNTDLQSLDSLSEILNQDNVSRYGKAVRRNFAVA